jgi:chitodextrinase
MQWSDVVRGRRNIRVLAGLVPLVAVLALSVTGPAAAQAAGVTATFSKSSDWGSGFVGHYEIRNGGTTAIQGWKLEFDLPAGERLTSAWSARMSSSGNHYVLTDEDWTHTIAPGTSVDVGFQGEYGGQFAAPTNCKLNGQSCANGAPTPPPPTPDTTSPTAPTNLVASAPTTSSITLNWTAATDNVGVTGYSVFRGSSKVATTTSTSATVSGLSPGTTYTFTVRAADAAGNLSPASNATTARTLAAASGPLTATFVKTSDWGSGFVGNYAIRNSGTATVNGWKLEFDLPSSETVTSAWSGKLSSSGNHYTLTDESWTHTIAPGSSVQVGFEGAYSGQFVAPANCRLNGQPCGGGPTPPPDTAAPSAPTGLAVTGKTSSSVALGWNAASDNVGVTGYGVYSGQTKVAITTSTGATVTGLMPATGYTFTVRATDAAGNVSPSSNPVSVTTGPLDGGGGSGSGSGATPATFAPYVDMTLSSDSLAEMMRGSGDRHMTLAFIVSGAPCTASWGGYYGIDDPTINRRIADLKAAGGDAIISFGGAINQELARTCTSVSALAAQYQAVIDRYGIRDLDFDIEGADQGDAASLDRRFRAIAQVQAAGLAAGKPVHVSLTLPVMPTGLTNDGLNVVRTAIADGADVGTVNVMAMDYFDPSLNYAGRMGDYAIQAAIATQGQLAQLYPGRSDARLWRMVGVTPMIGINDDNKEIFTTQDASKLTSFAIQKGLGRLAMWSLNRDGPCPTPAQWTSNTCSGVADPKWAFSAAFQSFGS